MTSQRRFNDGLLCNFRNFAQTSSQYLFANGRNQDGRIVANGLAQAVRTLRYRRIKVQGRIPLFVFDVRARRVLQVRAVFKDDLRRRLMRLPRASRIKEVRAPSVKLRDFRQLIRVGSRFYHFNRVSPRRVLQRIQVRAKYSAQRAEVNVRLNRGQFNRFIRLNGYPNDLVLRAGFRATNVARAKGHQ